MHDLWVAFRSGGSLFNVPENDECALGERPSLFCAVKIRDPLLAPGSILINETKIVGAGVILCRILILQNPRA